MFEYAAFVVRNPAWVTKNMRRQGRVRRAMLAHKANNPVCAATGKTRNLHVHHIVPVSVSATLAARPSNLITLERKAHLVIGHGGNYKSYVANVVDICRMMRIQRTRGA